MQTKDIKELRKLNSVHEGHYTGFNGELNINGTSREVYSGPSQVVIEIPTVGKESPVNPMIVYPELIGHQIAKVYMNSVDEFKREIDKTFQVVYGRPLVFSEGHTFEIHKKMQEMQNVSVSNNVANMVREFRTYLGYPCSFYRTQGVKRVAVETERIISAYKAMKSKSPVRTVEKILYE